MQHPKYCSSIRYPILIIHISLMIVFGLLNGIGSHLFYHWQAAMDFVEVDVHSDVPGAQVQGMDVRGLLMFAVFHSQRRPTEARGGGGGQHRAGHCLLKVCVHVVLTKIVFLWQQAKVMFDEWWAVRYWLIPADHHHHTKPSTHYNSIKLRTVLIVKRHHQNFL